MRFVLIASLSVSALAGCALLSSPSSLPEWSSLDVEQLVIHSDFELPSDHHLVMELAALRGEISEKLGLPVTDKPIHVYLFARPEQYAAYIRKFYPGLPDRRAFFIASEGRLSVYSHWGDRVAEDLRHEVTHGYLHAVRPQLPLWLDEGIAEYFEVPPAAEGRNVPHVELLSELLNEGRWMPDLVRLEQLTTVSQMEQRDYAESWLWIHFLLHSTPSQRATLQSYLSNFRPGGPATPLSSALGEPSNVQRDQLLNHLAALAA